MKRSIAPACLRWPHLFVTAALLNLSLATLPGAQPETKEFNLKLDFDKLLAAPDLWDTTPEKLDTDIGKGNFKSNPYFKWLTESHESARFAKHPYNNVSVDLTAFDGKVPLDEAVLDFKGGKLIAVNLSLYNRGDSGKLDRQEFEARYKAAGAAIGQWLGVHPVEHRPSAEAAIKTGGWLWTSAGTLALLEYNADALTKSAAAEFMRLKLAPPSQKDVLLNIAAIGRGSTALKRSELPQFVKKETNGDVYVSGIPMVDQGDKGYCVVAACQRMFGYFHIPCDEHELAALAGSNSQRGTSLRAFEETLKKVDNRFKTRFKPLLMKRPGLSDGNRLERPDHFLKMIQDHVDAGLPLLWSVELGLVPENPPLRIQGKGGHMRIIMGYNNTDKQVLYTDSWGKGHELKRLKVEDAITATTVVYELEPRDLF